ncbi:MAG: HAMP domain-containing histidine kinase [Rhizobacter sp.]|nr:HAMP domain-containing histidine kinase [Rhizobacter sp.]
MTVRLKLALTVFATGLLTALLVIAAVIYAFQRFEHETVYRRGSAFLQRVVANYDDLFELYERRPDEFQGWLRNMVLFEPDTQLYLLDPKGTVLACSGKPLPPGFKVALGPVLQAVGKQEAAYVMGDDPERMDADAVVAVQPVRRAVIRSADPVAGYLYLVLHTEQLPDGRWAALRMSIARPALWLIVAVVALTTLLALLIIVSVTRPLRRLTDAVALISQRGLDENMSTAKTLLPPRTRDEFGQLTGAFEMMLDICLRQWTQLRRLDHFRREGVSNLSHDLRSPLTATAACLETLEGRWAGTPDAAGTARADDDRRLVEIALRNTRNAARLVQSLGDLAELDEPEFRLRTEMVDAGELLDDICIRFAERAAKQGVNLRAEHGSGDAEVDAERGLGAMAVTPPFAALDIELFERAIANLVDNALKFCPAGARITLAACVKNGRVQVSVRDTGPGIAATDLPHLFDRFYQSRQSVAPATGEGGKGLGLAIVKRIAELHGGTVEVSSVPGAGTRVVLSVPAAD